MSRLDYCNMLLVVKTCCRAVCRLPRTMLPALSPEWACVTTSRQPCANSAGCLSTSVSNTRRCSAACIRPSTVRMCQCIFAMGWQMRTCGGEEPASDWRSADHYTMCKLIDYGRPMLLVAAPSYWNHLLEDLRGGISLSTFKRRPKAHLFSENFGRGGGTR